jgi:hypothetical protein
LEDNIKVTLKKQRVTLNWTQLAYYPAADTLEHKNETSGSAKDEVFIDNVSDHQRFRNDTTP